MNPARELKKIAVEIETQAGTDDKMWKAELDKEATNVFKALASFERLLDERLAFPNAMNEMKTVRQPLRDLYDEVVVYIKQLP